MHAAFAGGVAAGFSSGDYEPAALWPDCWAAWTLYCRVSTQWRVAPSGSVTGLDYAAVYPLLDRLAKDADEWDDLFDDLRHIESEALTIMARAA